MKPGQKTLSRRDQSARRWKSPLLGRDLRWANWYINRGRLPPNPTKRDLRAISWRRVK